MTNGPVIVEVPVSPTMVLVAFLPTKMPSRAENNVDVARVNCWSAVHEFELARLSCANTAPVVGEMVSDDPLAVTELTPPTHTPLTAKHPAARSMPPVDTNVVVAVRKFAIPPIEKTVPGVEVPIPTRPLLSIVSAANVDVANVDGDDVARNNAPAIERNVHGVDVSDPSLSASCGRVDDASDKVNLGVVVPIPTTGLVKPFG